MAPKTERFQQKETGRLYRYSSDRRYFVFEDNGQRVPVPLQLQPSRTEAGPSSHADRAPASEVDRVAEGVGSVSIGERSSRIVPDSGITEWVGEDRQTGIQSNWEIGPTQQEPESGQRPPRAYNPKFIRSNGPAALNEASGSTRVSRLSNRGFGGYKQSADPESDFVLFRVVEILFIPPPASALSTITGGAPQSSSRDEVVTRMRRFVIIGRGGRRSFRALPIKTYNGQGVSASGVVKSHHAIIYSGRKPPKPMSSERPQRLSNNQAESGLLPQPIRVKEYDRETTLDPKSRLDYFDLHEFDDNHFFKAFGTIHEESRPYLLPQYEAVRAALELATQQTARPSLQYVLSSAQPGSQIDDLSREERRIVSDFQEIRQYASRNSLPDPTMTMSELSVFARNQDAYQQWRQRLMADLRARGTAEDEDEEDEDESSDNEEDPDDDYEDDHDTNASRR